MILPPHSTRSKTFKSRHHDSSINLSLDDMCDDGEPVLHITTSDQDTRPLDVRVAFIDSTRDFQMASVSARNLDAETVRVIDVSAPIAMGEGTARQIAQQILNDASQLSRTASFTISPHRLDLEVTDFVIVPNTDGIWQIQSLSGITTRRAVARQISSDLALNLNGSEPQALSPLPWVSKPDIFVLDLPDAASRGTRQGPLVGAMVTPFNPITIIGPDGDTVALTAPVVIGALLTDLPAGPVGRWDHANTIDILIKGVDLASVTNQELFSGANRFSIETDTGWEIIQAQNIELIGSDTYRLSRLLRGLAGTDADMQETDLSGARITYLGQGWADLPLSISHIGDVVELKATSSGRDSDPVSFTYEARHLRPYSPVHGKVETQSDGTTTLYWIRRSRVEGDSWAGLDIPLGEAQELYHVEIDGVVSSAQSTAMELNDVPEDAKISQVSPVFGAGAVLNVN